MPRRALAEKRPYLMLSIVAALAFYYLQVSDLPEFYLWPIKGSACAFLAIYAWMRHSSDDARQIAAAMAVASVADMVMEFDLRVGAGVFIVFHIILIRLFLRHPRKQDGGKADPVLIALLTLVPLAGYFIPSDPVMQWLAAGYACVLGIMAASAWRSDFPRWIVAAGAILFVASDLVIFGGIGPLADAVFPGTQRPLTDMLVWPLYYLAQLLITVGVITTLRKRNPELRVVQGGKNTLH